MFKKNKISKDTVSGSLGITDKRANEIMDACISVLKDEKIKKHSDDIEEILKRASITDKTEAIFAGFFYGSAAQKMCLLQNKLQEMRNGLREIIERIEL